MQRFDHGATPPVNLLSIKAPNPVGQFLKSDLPALKFVCSSSCLQLTLLWQLHSTTSVHRGTLRAVPAGKQPTVWPTSAAMSHTVERTNTKRGFYGYFKDRQQQGNPSEDISHVMVSVGR